ncbi:hypothetical protein H0H87_012813, partial [Tephrocybe sp. NHM501043]
RKPQMAAAIQAANAVNGNGNGGGGVPVTLPGPGPMPGGPGGPRQGPRGVLNSHMMQLVIGYAKFSVEELRHQGVQDKVIKFVETNRAYLQRMTMESGISHAQFSNQGMHPNQHGPPGMGTLF